MVTQNNAEGFTTLLADRNTRQGRRARIAEGAMDLITVRLTDLYNDSITAHIRELISNAMDATSHLKTDASAIRVTSPTLASPYFVVEDCGTGMTLDTVENGFVDYGGSDKGGDKKSIGSYGLGGKSPLAYASQFTLDTVRDGERTELTMYLDGEGIPAWDTRTLPVGDRENGTIVKVPVVDSDLHAFSRVINLYKEMTFSRPLTIDGVEYTGEEFVNVGRLDVNQDDEHVTGNMWIRKAESHNLVNHYSSIPMAFTIGGFPYASNGDTFSSRSTRDDFSNTMFIELEPGVDGLAKYNSARDAIVPTKSTDNIRNAFSRWSEDSTSAVNAYLGCVGKMTTKEALDSVSSLTIYTSKQEGEKKVSTKVVTMKKRYDSVEANVSDFVDAEGNNVVKDRLEAYANNNALGAFRFTVGGYSAPESGTLSHLYIGNGEEGYFTLFSPSGADKGFRSSNNRGGVKVTVVNERLTTGFDVPVQGLTPYTVVESLLHNRSKAILVSVDSVEQMTRIVRRRRAIADSLGSSSTMFIFLDPSKHDVKVWEKELSNPHGVADSGFSVESKTHDELIDLAKKSTVTTASTRNTSVQTTVAVAMEAKESGFDFLSTLISSRQGSYGQSERETSLGHLMSEDKSALLYVLHGNYIRAGLSRAAMQFAGWAKTVGTGIDSLAGRQLYVALAPRADIINDIADEDMDRVVFATNYSSRSNALMGKVDNRMYHQVDGIEDMMFSMLPDGDIKEYAKFISLSRYRETTDNAVNMLKNAGVPHSKMAELAAFIPSQEMEKKLAKVRVIHSMMRGNSNRISDEISNMKKVELLLTAIHGSRYGLTHSIRDANLGDDDQGFADKLQAVPWMFGFVNDSNMMKMIDSVESVRKVLDTTAAELDKTVGELLEMAI